MPARVSSIKSDSLDKLFSRIAERGVLSTEEFYDLVEEVLQAPVQVTAGRAAVLSKQRLKSHTGNLSRSIIGRVIRVDNVPAAQIGIIEGPAARYAGVQELGTRRYNPRSPYTAIKPRNAKALAFPPKGSPVLTAAGVDVYGGPREVPWDLTFIPIKRGNVVGVLYRTQDLITGEGESRSEAMRRANAVYLLLRRVSLRGNFFLRDGMKAGVKKDLIPALRALLRTIISESSSSSASTRRSRR